jgi:hypothetical protein
MLLHFHVQIHEIFVQLQHEFPESTYIYSHAVAQLVEALRKQARRSRVRFPMASWEYNTFGRNLALE